MSDVTTRKASTEGLSPKTIAATFLAAVLGVAIAIANLAQDNPALLGALPPAVQSVALIAIPPVLIALSTYKAAVGRVAIPESDLPVMVEAAVVDDDRPMVGEHRAV